MELKGQSAIVTGGASGLGAETARHFAKEGARVAILDLNGDLAREVAAEVNGVGIECDVADPRSAEAALAEARSKHGPARILANCAGIGGAKRIVGKEGPMTLEEFNRIVQVNLVGTFNMMRLVAAEMSKLEPLEDGERGVIISTTSVAIRRTNRAGRLCRFERRNRFAHLAGCARARAVRNSRARDRAGIVFDPASLQATAGGAEKPGRVDPVSETAGARGRIRAARRAYRY
jgi:NAD(P)-dependent dehydrogenase (short-subunit alcohol dehydrogenase family)